MMNRAPLAVETMPSIDWELEVAADAPNDQLEEVKRLADEHCPGVWCVRNPVDLVPRLPQSFNMRGRKKVTPYYDLIANIAAEEYGHIELVSAVINGLLSGASDGDEPHDTPLEGLKDGAGLRHHWINSGLGALPVNSLGQGWNGEYVFNSGDLVLDLLHNFFLENGARMAKIRVYETTDHPIARQMLGYLFMRGVHALAYAKALEEPTGADVKKMLPIPSCPTPT